MNVRNVRTESCTLGKEIDESSYVPFEEDLVETPVFQVHGTVHVDGYPYGHRSVRFATMNPVVLYSPIAASLWNAAAS